MDVEDCNLRKSICHPAGRRVSSYEVFSTKLVVRFHSCNIPLFAFKRFRTLLVPQCAFVIDFLRLHVVGRVDTLSTIGELSLLSRFLGPTMTLGLWHSTGNYSCRDPIRRNGERVPLDGCRCHAGTTCRWREDILPATSHRCAMRGDQVSHDPSHPARTHARKRWISALQCQLSPCPTQPLYSSQRTPVARSSRRRSRRRRYAIDLKHVSTITTIKTDQSATT